MTAGEIGFWSCFAAVFYIYVGYPLMCALLGAIVNRRVHKSDIEPYVTVVIAAFNEALEIERTVVNKLSQNYPAGRLKIVVVSDGSTDGTDEIVRRLAEASGGRVTLLRQEPRQGKTQGLNMALRQVSGDIVVFSDANSIYAPDALRMIVRNFADSSVGYVTGRMIYTNPDKTGVGEGSGSFMSYEGILRTVETRLGSIVGVDGGIDAVRRELYVPMRADQLPDFVLPLNVVEQGKRVIYEPDAVVFEQALSDATDEFRMRVRVSLRALWALYDKRRLFNPFQFFVFAWQLVSHKLLRYTAFLPLFGLLAFNLLVAGRHPFYRGFLMLQLVAYGIASLGHFLKYLSFKMTTLFVPYYFVVLNAACAVAFCRFLAGQRMAMWKPRKGA